MAVAGRFYRGDADTPVSVYPSWAEGVAQLWLAPVGHVELTKAATEALRDELTELLENW